MFFPLPVPLVAELPRAVTSCWYQQCVEEVVYAALSGIQGSGGRDALCSWSFPNTIQLSGLFWERRILGYSTSPLSAESAWALAEGVEKEGFSWEGCPWRGLGSPVLPKVPQTFLFPTHSLIAAFEPPCYSALAFWGTPRDGSSTGAGGRGIPWGSVKADVGHKTRCKPRELQL